jgi:hypothetical protein
VRRGDIFLRSSSSLPSSCSSCLPSFLCPSKSSLFILLLFPLLLIPHLLLLLLLLLLLRGCLPLPYLRSPRYGMFCPLSGQPDDASREILILLLACSPFFRRPCHADMMFSRTGWLRKQVLHFLFLAGGRGWNSQSVHRSAASSLLSIEISGREFLRGPGLFPRALFELLHLQSSSATKQKTNLKTALHRVCMELCTLRKGAR